MTVLSIYNSYRFGLLYILAEYKYYTRPDSAGLLCFWPHINDRRVAGIGNRGNGRNLGSGVLYFL